MPLRRTGTLAAFVAAIMLAGCGSSDEQKGTRTVPVELKKSEALPMAADSIDGITPMNERVAELGLLNKRNGLVQHFTMSPGEERRMGPVLVRLRACEVTAPWENIPETGAFLQLVVQNQRDEKWYRVFSGWVFRERPERNVMEHPIYDVFVKSCAMTYPGGEAVERSVPAEVTSSASSAPQSPTANGGEGNAPVAADAAAPPVPAAAAPTTPTNESDNTE